MDWSVVYKRAVEPDGSLLFPERLNQEFLDQMRRTMGSYLYANQYMNEVIPDDEKVFKPHWLRYFKEIPELTYRFAFIDPAIGQNKHHDYTGITVVDVDESKFWYLRVASRYRITPTEIISKLFDLHEEFGLKGIGIETVAYQEALLYMLDEEMKRRGKMLPVVGIKHNTVNKNSRILSLVPRFEWGRLYVARGMIDFEDEYATFPRGSHDDILDSLASLEEIVFYPRKEETKIEKPHSPADPSYEKWIIHNYQQRQGDGEE